MSAGALRLRALLADFGTPSIIGRNLLSTQAYNLYTSEIGPRGSPR